METRALFLSCSSRPAVCPSLTADRLFREAVFRQTAWNDRRTEHMSTSQSQSASTKPGTPPVHSLPPFWWWTLLGTWEEFTGRSSEHLPWKTSLLLQDPAEKVQLCGMQHQSPARKSPASPRYPQTQHWHVAPSIWDSGSFEKTNPTVTAGSDSVLAPESSSNFCSFVRILLLFQWGCLCGKSNQRGGSWQRPAPCI